MANMNDVCEETVRSVTGALAFAVIDLQSGQLLACVHTVPYYTQRYLESVASAAVDMFRGSGITNMESMLAGLRGTQPERSIQEVQLSTSDSYQFAMVVPRYPDILLMLITSKEASLGLGWMSIRTTVPKIEAVLA